MSKYKSVLFLVLVLSAVATAIGGMAIGVLYQTAVNEERLRLRVTAQSQARLIEVMARFDQAHAGDLPGGPEAATLSKIKEAHARYEGFGDTGEFTLARRDGSQIVFVLSRRHDKPGQSRPVPINSSFAEPMRRALSGQSGTLIGLDYRGEPVLAAYEPVSVINLGIVAKIDMAEVRAPFIRAGVFISSIALLLIGLGSAIFFRINDPMIKRLKESEDRFRDFAESASDWFWEMGPDLRFTFFSDRIRDILGVDPNFYIGKTRNEQALIKEDPELWEQHFDDLKNHRPFRDFQYTIRRENKNTQVIRVNGKPVFDDEGNFLGYRGTGSNVTEQVKMERQARTTEQQLIDAIDSIPQGVALFDADDLFVRCNINYRESLPEISHLLVPGTPFGDIIRTLAEHGTIAGTKDDPETFIRERMGDHRKLKGARQHQRTDGTWILVQEFRTRDGGTFLVRTDITDIKRAEQAVFQSEARFKDIAESASDWFWETGPDLRFVYVSDRYYKVTGRKPQDVLGKTREETVDEEAKAADPERWRKHLEDINARRPFSGFVMSSSGGKGSKYEGSRYHLRISGKPRFDEQGKFLGYIGAATDITDTVRHEQELRLAKESAENANRSKSEFLANMSHELRTPLNAIIGFSGTIKEEIFGAIGNEKYAEYITDIHDSGAHLLELINDILDVSVIEAGKLELDERDMDLAEIAKASYRLVKSRAEKGRVRVVNQMIGRLPHLFGDERRVKQILLNLLTNAIKFTPENGTVTMAVRLDDDGSLLVAVSDTGVGMNEADIDKALSPFGQADSSVARKEEGTGLGLPLTKGLMEGHGGTLEIKSTPGEGTTATVRFPAKRVILKQPR